jgi:choice-of-anchor A domain-containing protein
MTERAHPACHRLIRLAPLLLLAAAGSLLHAQTTQQQQQADVTSLETDYSNFNLISFGTTSLTSYGDTQGGLAVDGSLTLDAGSIATQPGTFGLNSNPTLYLTGSSLTLNGTVMLNSGYASLRNLNSNNWTWDGSQDTLSGGGGALNSTNATGSSSYASQNPINNPAPSGWNWSTETSSLSTISTSLKNASATGTIAVNSNNLVFTAPNGQTSGVVVFSLNAANITNGNTYNGQGFSNIQINVPTGLTYVINVINAGGRTLFANGVNFNSGSNDNQLLWNFEGSGTVTLDNGGYFYGAILAPSASISATTVIDGQVAADGFSDCGYELHDTEFTPAAVATPEPSTYALCAVGLCAFAIAARRFLRLLVRRTVLA